MTGQELQLTTLKTGIYGIYKPVGFSPAQAVTLLKSQRLELANIPLTYAGRLDPMAEGLLLLLDSSVIKNKEDFLHLDKTYKVKILLGISTDSFDLLGIPALGHLSKDLSVEEIHSTIQKLTGPITLPLPPYSSPPVNGKPLFMHAQQGTVTEFTTPLRTTTIHSIEDITTTEINSQNLRNYIRGTVPGVDGNFRLEEILESWENFLQNDIPFTLITFTVSVSHGTYIRSIAHHLGKILGTGACIYTLERTRVGPFTLAPTT